MEIIKLDRSVKHAALIKGDIAPSQPTAETLGEYGVVDLSQTEQLRIVTMGDQLINHLRKVDEHVMINSGGLYVGRYPYVGPLFGVERDGKKLFRFYAPMTRYNYYCTAATPFAIRNPRRRDEILGELHLSKSIPTPSENFVYRLGGTSDEYKKLISLEEEFIAANQQKIIKNAMDTYALRRFGGRPMYDTCDFEKLERAAVQWTVVGR